MLVPSIFVDWNRDVSALTQGFSLQNLTQIAVFALVAAWAGWLLLSGAVRISTFAVGLNCWLGMILALYGLSTIWSIWPPLTVFRTVELGALWVLCLHLFSARPPLARLTVCLLVGALLILLGSVVYITEHHPAEIWRWFISNPGGMLAGALLLVVFFRLLILRERRSLVFLIPALVVFGFFDSLASATALLFAMTALLVFRFGRNLSRGSQLTVVAVALAVVAVLVYEAVYRDPDTLAWIAWASGKNAENVADAHGRAQLWTEIWQVTRNNAFGFGFGAGERLLYEMISTVPGHMTGANNAHNGFLAAWLSGGWLGEWLVIFLFVASALDATRRSYYERAYRLPLIIFLAINNNAFPGIGGAGFSAGWFVMMVLACAGPVPVPEAARNVAREPRQFRDPAWTNLPNTLPGLRRGR
jgi:hypothetical protein